MVFAMSRPVSRPNSSFAQFRKRVPADIQRVVIGKKVVFKLPPELPGTPGLVVSAKLGSEVTFSLRTRDPALVKLRHAAASAQLEAHFQALRSGPQPLSKKTRVALSGLLYKAFAESCESDPGDPELWRRVRDANEYALNGQHLYIDTFPGEGRIRLLEERFGGLVDLILARESVAQTRRAGCTFSPMRDRRSSTPPRSSNGMPMATTLPTLPLYGSRNGKRLSPGPLPPLSTMSSSGGSASAPLRPARSPPGKAM
jgi:hypothetical protein